MARLTSRINLSANQFPLLSELHGRTVIVGTHDQNATPGANLNPNATTGEIGIPQVYYAHNVMPTPQGYKSVGYFQFASPTGVSYDFVSAHTIRDPNGNAGTLGVTADGKLYMLRFGTSAWLALVSPPGLAGARVTTAFVQGVTYIYFAKVGCYRYDFPTLTMISITLTSLVPSVIIGIIGNSGYLLAYSEIAIAWSSTVSATDFTPSLITGAGGGQVEGLQGKIKAAVSIYGGFIIQGDANAVACVYQANSRYPFAFVPVVGCGGLSDAGSASYQASDSEFAYVYTTSGLQAISLREAVFLLPEATEFFSGSRFEDFDEETNTLTVTSLETVLKKQIAFIADRYLVISYGITSFTHALVIDIVLKRVGKLKIDHVAIFEFQLYDQTIYETPKKSIGVLLNDGTVKLVDTDIAAPASNGVMILGKYQYVRARLLTMESVELENTIVAAETSLHLVPTMDGKTMLPAVPGYNTGLEGLTQKWNFHIAGYNHSLLVKGRFNLVSGVISYQINGKTGLA